MPIERSHGEERAQNWRVDELPPAIANTDVTAPDRDENTGRFVPGNAASRRRKLKGAAKVLVSLDPAHCDPWLRPSIELAVTHATDIIAGLPVQSAALNALAVDTATATAVYRGLLALGAQGDAKALSEARAWLREARQRCVSMKLSTPIHETAVAMGRT